MNVEETQVNTSSGTGTVTTSITAAAETLLVAVGGIAGSGAALLTEDLTLSGWTEINQTRTSFTGVGICRIGVWWKYNETAGTVDATMEHSVTTAEMILQVLEVSGGSFIDNPAGVGTDYAYGNGSDTSPLIPATLSTSKVAVEREGNIVLFCAAIDNAATVVSPPTNYSTANETDGTGWCLATYWRTAPYSTSWTAQAGVSSAVDYNFFTAQLQIDVKQSAFMGDF